MCQCDPSIRSPYCGKPGCEFPFQTGPGEFTLPGTLKSFDGWLWIALRHPRVPPAPQEGPISKGTITGFEGWLWEAIRPDPQ